MNLGALCVIDREPKLLSDEQREGLELLADEVMARFEFRRKELELQQKHEGIVHSLEEKRVAALRNSSSYQE